MPLLDIKTAGFLDQHQAYSDVIPFSFFFQRDKGMQSSWCRLTPIGLYFEMLSTVTDGTTDLYNGHSRSVLLMEGKQGRGADLY